MPRAVIGEKSTERLLPPGSPEKNERRGGRRVREFAKEHTYRQEAERMGHERMDSTAVQEIRLP
jgi:hypothetical protein